MDKSRRAISTTVTTAALAAGLTLPITGTATAATLQPTTSGSNTAAPQISSRGMLRSLNYRKLCVRHAFFQGELTPCPTRSSDAADFYFKAVPVQGHSNLYRLAATNKNLTRFYLRHENYRIVLSKVPPKSNKAAYTLFLKDSAFYLRTGRTGKGISFESYNFPGWYIRHRNFHLYISKEGEPGDRHFEGDASFSSFNMID